MSSKYIVNLSGHLFPKLEFRTSAQMSQRTGFPSCNTPNPEPWPRVWCAIGVRAHSDPEKVQWQILATRPNFLAITASSIMNGKGAEVPVYQPRQDSRPKMKWAKCGRKPIDKANRPINTDKSERHLRQSRQGARKKKKNRQKTENRRQRTDDRKQTKERKRIEKTGNRKEKRE